MIDLIPGLEFSDSEKQLYGSIVGAILGALIGAIVGALSTFIIGNRERKKQDELQKITQNRSFIRENATSLHSMQISISDLLIKCEANNEYAKDIQKGLIKKDGGKTLALMQLSTPFQYPQPDVSYTEKMLNDNIITYWSNFCQEVELQNKNIDDFAQYYKMLSSTIHSALLKGDNIDQNVVESDSITIKSGMDQQLAANSILRDKCINLLALIDCFASYLDKTDARDFTSLSQYRTFMERIISYEPSFEELETAKSKENSTFNPAIMFKSQSTDKDEVAEKPTLVNKEDQ